MFVTCQNISISKKKKWKQKHDKLCFNEKEETILFQILIGTFVKNILLKIVIEV